MTDKTDEEIGEIIRGILKYADDLIGEGKDPLNIAAVLVSQGYALYRTMLTEEDFEGIIKSIYDSREHVVPIYPTITKDMLN
jgi:hypothetical protein